MHNQPVSFPTWKQSLVEARLAPAAEAAFAREIITFLKYCKTSHVPATVLLAKHYVKQQERLRSGPVREALRWFFRAAKSAGTPALDVGKPSRVAPGLGRPPRTVPSLRPSEPRRAGDDLGT